MVKQSYSSDFNQYDPKKFRETLGTFGTTTIPGQNQLQELQAKIRQGVKHVELHLNRSGKGEFNANDVPDKYGFEHRRTIMQLAKLNNQSLSVHSSLDITSFAGMAREGYDAATRWDSIKEMDETMKFAAETTKGGAVVMHLQGEPHNQTSRTQLTLTNRYQEWMKKNGKGSELDKLKKDYLDDNPLKRLFVDDPSRINQIQSDYSNLAPEVKVAFESKNKQNFNGMSPAEFYFIKTQNDKVKLSNISSHIAIGDQLSQVDRKSELVDIKKLSEKKDFTDKEKKFFDLFKVNVGSSLSVDDFQKLQGIFSSDTAPEVFERAGFSKDDFKNLRDEYLVTYDKVLKNNDNLYSNADTEFYKKVNEITMGSIELQKKKFNLKHEMFKSELDKVKKLEKENRDAFNEIEKYREDNEENNALKDSIKIAIAERNEDISKLKYNTIGQEDYHMLSNYDEQIADFNKKIKDIEQSSTNARSLAEDSFDKNISGLSYVAFKGLKYQLDMKKKSKEAETVLPKLKNELKGLEKRYASSKDFDEQENINNEMSKKKREIRKWVGVKDYKDIDVIKNPLYISPENMLPGMGNLTSLEEFKAVVRVGQSDFAKKLFGSNEDFYKSIKEDYEKETGKKINSEADALEVAQRHLIGTLDTAHAGSWFKHFNPLDDNGKPLDEGARIEKFNDWLKNQAKDLVEQKLVKHVHFNDTQGKDDDHNTIGTGILDMHELRHTLRKAGVNEAMIVEAGGRGAHLQAAFNLFNPSLNSYGIASGSGISDWVSVERNYSSRQEFSSYGMNESSFKHAPPQQGQQRGDWSGTNFF